MNENTFVQRRRRMGCGSSSVYRKEEIDRYIEKEQMHYPSAELIDGKQIQLTSNDGFYNSNALLDTSWFQGRLTNNEYRQSIEHINQRVAQTKIGQSKTLSIDQIGTFQSTKLAIEELNEKFNGKVRFTYHQDDHQRSNKSFLLIDFPSI